MFNIYEALRLDAVKRARKHEVACPEEAAYYRHLARIHHAASLAWMARRKAQIEEAKRLASLPVAKLAPPLPKVEVKPTQPRYETRTKKRKDRT
jgi:hypothetical protein